MSRASESQAPLTIPDKLVLAAYALGDDGKRPFSAEDLVISAWRQFPDAFGLAGHTDENGRATYPDSNRVYMEIMGPKPVLKRGLLKKVGKKQYRLTEAGRAHARFLKSQSVGELVEKIGVSREIRKELRRLLNSKAMGKVRDGRLDDMTFYNAASFWGISPRTTAIQFHGRVNNLMRIVEVAQTATRDKAVSLRHGGEIFSSEDLDAIVTLHEQMLERFGSEIDVILSRTR